MHVFHATSSTVMCITPHSLPHCWGVRRNNSHSVAVKDNTESSGTHKSGSPNHLQPTYTNTVLQVTCSISCHMDHCPIAPFPKDACRHHLQEAGIVQVLPVVIYSQACMSDVSIFFCMLGCGKNKLFPDYRDLSYMHIILCYTMSLITNILEITDSSSGKTSSFL